MNWLLWRLLRRLLPVSGLDAFVIITAVVYLRRHGPPEAGWIAGAVLLMGGLLRNRFRLCRHLMDWTALAVVASSLFFLLKGLLSL